MKKLGMTFLFLLALAPLAKAQNCDCTIVPYKPPCFDKCTTKLLATATIEELQLFVGMKENVARKIVGWKGRTSAKTLKDYNAVLTDEEIKNVGKKINSLGERQLEYFQKPASEKALVRRELKELLTKSSG